MIYRTREQWGAEFDVSTLAVVTLPRPHLFIHHTAGTWTDDPSDDMLTIERVDINRFGKPSYKWVIHPSGVVLEGTTIHRSPDTLGYNDDLSICFMGNFENDTVTDAAMFAARELVARIVSYGWLADGWKVMGHRDVYATACPGRNLYPRIQELVIPPPIPIQPAKEDDDMMTTAVLPDGTVLLFVVGLDSAVWHNQRNPDGTFGVWGSLGGRVRGDINNTDIKQ